MRFEVVDGCFQYEKEKDTLSHINFQIDGPQVAAVLGANGAGKTTLMRCMLGFLRWNQGKTMLDGEDISHMSRKKLWSRIAYVPQAKQLSFAYSVREMVVMGRNSHIGDWGMPGKKDWEIVDECLEQVGITHLADKMCNQISGGEYQMVLIARALAAKPELLILDEPESNLDFRNQMIVLDTIRTLCDDYKIAAIMNTHYPEHALDISDQALLMYPDGTNAFGNTREILQEKNLENAFGVTVHMREIELPGRKYTCVVPSRLLTERNTSIHKLPDR